MSKGEYSSGNYGSQLEDLKYVDFDGDGNAEAFIVIGTTQEVAGAYWAGDFLLTGTASPFRYFKRLATNPRGSALRVNQ